LAFESKLAHSLYKYILYHRIDME